MQLQSIIVKYMLTYVWLPLMGISHKRFAAEIVHVKQFLYNTVVKF